jgi:short-subunit dehydrogenase
MKKIALITGASSGFGSIMATKLSNEFKCIDEIYLIARRKERLEELSKTISKPCKIIQMDLTQTENINKLHDIVREDNVSIKILANCAGFGIYGEFEGMDEKKCAGMIDLNCKALTLITRKMLPYMSYNSRIINIASAAAFVPQKNFAVYAASKSYVLSFTRALNEELKGTTVSATAVCPGPANTEFFDIALESSETIPFYKKMFMADAEKVVDKAIYDAIIKKEVSVYSLPMKMLRVISKVVPTDIIFKFM